MKLLKESWILPFCSQILPVPFPEQLCWLPQPYISEALSKIQDKSSHSDPQHLYIPTISSVPGVPGKKIVGYSLLLIKGARIQVAELISLSRLEAPSLVF